MSDDIDFLLSGGDLPEKPEKYEQAEVAVINSQRASTSWLQRHLGIGYNKAAELIAALEAHGVISEANHVGRREVLAEAPEEPPEPEDEPEEEEEDVKPRARARSKASGARAPTVAVVQTLLQPVSITLLADVLQRDKKTVGKRLAGLAPMSHHRGNIPLYDFRQALEYLVTPRFNAAEAIKKMGTDDLPVGLQKDVWDARLKQQKWMEQAGDLWRTEDVLEVLGEAFQRLKTTTQLWIDQLSETHALPTEVRKDLTAMVDGLQKDLHQTLVEMPSEKSTRAQLGEIEGTDLDV